VRVPDVLIVREPGADLRLTDFLQVHAGELAAAIDMGRKLGVRELVILITEAERIAPEPRVSRIAQPVLLFERARFVASKGCATLDPELVAIVRDGAWRHEAMVIVLFADGAWSCARIGEGVSMTTRGGDA
jgi:hypothetical protein